MITAIIPTLNEAKVIARTVRSLLAQAGISRVVVADGGSSDDTVARVREMVDQQPGRVDIQVSAPGRGRQMNLGASVATSEWLLFHHADSLLGDDAADAIQALPDSVVWGGFTHRFAPGNWKLDLVSALHNYRCRRTGVIYGDQSMFVRRRFFYEMGGFREQGLEDLEFSDRALAHSGSHLLPQRVDTDSRKFTQIGEFRALAQTLSIIRRYERGRRIGHESFFQNYR